MDAKPLDEDTLSAFEYDPQHVQQQALKWLLEQQSAQGFWCGRLESNSCMEALWILLQHVLELPRDVKYYGVVQAILKQQRTDGSWEIFYEAPGGDINATIECYAALRIAGLSPESEPLTKAREWIFEHRALENCRVFTRYWLALIGEWPWEKTPSLPPEILFQPRWMPFHISRFASWARATIVPLTVVVTRKVTVPLSSDQKLDELFPQGRESFDYAMPKRSGWKTALFSMADRVLKVYEKMGWQPFREQAIEKALSWTIRRQDFDGYWGGIMPPGVYTMMAMRCEGYSLDHPVIKAGLSAFDTHWKIEQEEQIYLQASESSVWDTMLSLQALLKSGHRPETSEPMRQGIQWLLKQQRLEMGDWSESNSTAPGGWSFERANRYYPDLDDTAEAVIFFSQLQQVSSYKKQEIISAVNRAVEWMISMQSSDGGWAAFDQDNWSSMVTAIPFSDYGETVDPPSADVTAHVIEALALQGYGYSHSAVQKGVAFLFAQQEAEGSWFGRWGVNYIYGTWSALTAFAALGFERDNDRLMKAAEWLAAHQNGDGGWGESCRSYADDQWRGKGPSTASQTAWAILGLSALHYEDFSEAIQRGCRYLANTQTAEGTWEEPYFTGTGFPGYGIGRKLPGSQSIPPMQQGAELSRGFMINYHLYRQYFPVQALGRVQELQQQITESGLHSPSKAA